MFGPPMTCGNSEPNIVTSSGGRGRETAPPNGNNDYFRLGFQAVACEDRSVGGAAVEIAAQAVRATIDQGTAIFGSLPQSSSSTTPSSAARRASQHDHTSKNVDNRKLWRRRWGGLHRYVKAEGVVVSNAAEGCQRRAAIGVMSGTDWADQRAALTTAVRAGGQSFDV